MPEQMIICTGCPLGCHVTVTVSDKGYMESYTGNECKKGKEYVIAEYQSPVRVFTAAVLSEDGGRLLPVRTDKPIPKTQLKDLMRVVARIRVKPPVKIGQEITHDISGTGANLVATGNL